MAGELLVIDQAPLFGDAQDDCQRACLALEQLRAELDHHESRDLPAYNRWLNSTFGGVMTEVRELSARLLEKEQLLATLRKRHWATFLGSSSCLHAEAGLGQGRSDDDDENDEFAGMRAHWRAQEEEFSQQEADADAADGEEGSGEEYRYQERDRSHDDEEDFLFGDSESEWRFEEGLFNGAGRRSGTYRARDWSQYDESRFRSQNPSSKRQADSFNDALDDPRIRLKDRYRLLAKKLHPDHNADLTAEKRSLWNQVQAAYREGNLEKLDLLMALADVFSGAMSGFSSLHQLRAVTREIQRSIAPLRKKLSEARQTRAWQFCALRDRSEVQRLLEREFERELVAIRQQIARLDAQMERFLRPVRPEQYASRER